MLSIEEACQGFAAVGSEPRMGVLLALVRAGHEGLLFRDIADRTGLPGSTLSHHLRFLAAAELITQERRGRETINRPNFERLEHLSSFILATCCAAVPNADVTLDAQSDD
ncbi:MAG: helix-turn-helix domain-containing protein [Pseudomonadota bacterium]